MRAAVVGEWVVVSGGWHLFGTMREQALTPALAREVATWCEQQGDTESASELRWAASEAEKWSPEDESEIPEQSDDLITRIDELLSQDAMSWSPIGEVEAARILAGEQDETPRSWVNHQIHAVPVSDVSEWRAWWDGLSSDDQRETDWYVVCHMHGFAGERGVPCGCGNFQTDVVSMR